MHRYEELEKKYYIYKLKKFVIIIFVLIIGSGSFFYYYFSNFFLEEESNISFENAKEDKIYFLEFNSSLLKINMDKEKNKTNELVFSFNIPTLDETIKEENLKMKKETSSNLKQNSYKINFNKTNNSKFLIKEEKLTLNQLIKKFSISPSFETAIQVAKLYFEKNDLKNSQQWALKANSIDPYRYESWELFALILVKKGENKKAKEVLNTYLNDYGYNEKIEKLLRSLE